MTTPTRIGIHAGPIDLVDAEGDVVVDHGLVGAFGVCSPRLARDRGDGHNSNRSVDDADVALIGRTSWG